MSKKRILLIGNGNHQFMINLAVQLKRYNSIECIDILSYTDVIEKNKASYNKVYCINRNKIGYRVTSKLKVVRRLYRFYQYRKIINSFLQYYDIYNFHFLNLDSYFIVELVKKYKIAKIILSVWGSDMYQIANRYHSRFIRICKNADFISFTNSKSIDYFKVKYKWKEDNLRLCRFGLTPLFFLKNLTLTREECKAKLNWNVDKIAVVIGYNMSKGQQHIKILNCFENIEISKLCKDIQLIFPITYGGTLRYKNQLVEKLNCLPFEFKIYDSFLPDESIAEIRKASDIMIQLQKTDQFSGSTQEHLYSENVVITGSWLPYETMKEYGAWFLEIDNIEELITTLPSVVRNFEEYKRQTKNNSEAIELLSSWGNNINKWIDLYRER